MKRFGVLVISHGSRGEDWVRLVDEAVSAVRVKQGVPIVSSFLEVVDGRLIQDGIDQLEQLGVTDIAVVPMFVSSGSTHMDEIAYALGVTAEPKLETDLGKFRVRATIHLSAPIDDDPEVADIVLEKVADLSVDPSRELLLLIGHGSKEAGFHEQWRDGLHRLSARLKRVGGFAEVGGAMLLPDEAAATVKCWQQDRPDLTVVVAPLFLSRGYFTNKVIPERLAGLMYKYNGQALLPHPQVSRWMERRLATHGLVKTE